MKTGAFYRVLTDVDNNFLVEDVPLMVNCAGLSHYPDELHAAGVRHDYYVMYLWQGDVQIFAPDIKEPFQAGDLIVFSPETSFVYYKPPKMEMRYFWVHFSGSFAEEFLNRCGIRTNTVIPIGNHEHLCEDFNRLFESFLNRDAFFELEGVRCLTSLLMDFGRCIAGQKKGTSSSSPVSRALMYIHGHLSKPISVEALAGEEHMSVSHFRAVFHKATGLSPQDYITLTKLNYACELLRQTDLPVKTVGNMAGYTDPQYFSRVFHSRFHLSPGAYRRQMKAGMELPDMGSLMKRPGDH